MYTQDQNPEHGLDARQAFVDVNRGPVADGAAEVIDSLRGTTHRAVVRLRGVVRPSVEVQRHAFEQNTSPTTAEARADHAAYDPVAGALRILEMEAQQNQAVGAARADIAAIPYTPPVVETQATRPLPPQSEIADHIAQMGSIADQRYNSQGV